MEAQPKTATLEQLVTDYKNYQRIEEEAKEQKELLATEIKKALDDYGVTRVGPYKISWGTYERATIDGKLLKEKFPDIAKRVTSTSTYDRLTVN